MPGSLTLSSLLCRYVSSSCESSYGVTPLSRSVAISSAVVYHMEEVRRTPLVQPCHGFQQECRGMSFGIGFVSFIWSLRDLSIVVVSNLLVLGN